MTTTRKGELGKATTEDKYFEVRFLLHTYTPEDRDGSASVYVGSGQRRIWLSEIPTWLAQTPGVMICAMREV